MKELLNKQKTTFIASVDDNNIPEASYAPYVMIEDKIYIYFHGAAKGKKNCLIASNPVAGFEADRVLGLINGTTGCGCTMQYESVSGKGVLETISAVGEKEHALKVILEHYFKSGILPMDSAAVDATNVMRMKVTEISGKRFIKARPASKC